MTNLKPCPLCGDIVMIDREEIFCDCGLALSIEPYVIDDYKSELPTYEEARQNMIDKWNRRI